MNRFIDVHTHFYSTEFDQDREELIEKARQVGVTAVLLCAEGLAEFDKIISLADKYSSFCFPCLGVHPVQVTESGTSKSVVVTDFEEAVDTVRKHQEKLVAIGEVGLDFTPRWCKTPEDKEGQRQVLRNWVHVAKELNLPLNVHSRSSGRPTIQLLKEEGAKNVLLHAFDGKPSVALEGVKEGYYFSIPPSIVRSEQKNRLVDSVPLENLLLETDCPALGPTKEGRNEPSNITYSFEYIAKAKGLDASTVARQLFENSLKLFPKLKPFLKL